MSQYYSVDSLWKSSLSTCNVVLRIAGLTESVRIFVLLLLYIYWCVLGFISIASWLCGLNDHNTTEYCWIFWFILLKMYNFQNSLSDRSLPQKWYYLYWTSKDLTHWEIAIGSVSCLLKLEYRLLLYVAKWQFFKVTIMRLIILGDNYEAKWHLLIKISVIWHVRITIYDYF